LKKSIDYKLKNYKIKKIFKNLKNLLYYGVGKILLLDSQRKKQLQSYQEKN